MTGELAYKDRIRALKGKHMDSLADYRRHLYRHPDLRHLFFELTLRCNEHCFHCGSGCGAAREDGLPLAMYRDILDQVRGRYDISRIQLCITGGEPLLRKDFFDLLGYAHETGWHWGMTTNATLIDRETAHRLAQVGMGTVSVSIDGLEETHDAQRGLKGGWRLAMQGIENMIAEGVFHAIQVTTVINHQNIGQLDSLYRIFEKMDIDSWRVIGIEPIGRALLHPDRMLTPDDQRRLFSFIREKREARMPVSYGCSHFLGLDYEREVRDWYFLCNAGIYTASVRANGDITACLDIEPRPETVFGNVCRDSFTDIWENRFELFRKPLSDFNEECRACSYANWCAGGAHHSWDYDAGRQRVCMKGILFE